jgi:hypothetical protein
MVVGMSAADDVAPQLYGRIVIVGGGCYGGYYVRQLQRAAHASALVARELVVVDRDASCGVASLVESGAAPLTIPTRVVVQDWRQFFAVYLDGAAADPASCRNDAIVPSPLMPHLMAEWLVQRARSRWPTRAVSTAPLERPPKVPWERAGADGTHYVSFATWTCPINCIEPRTCPVTRGPRSWSLPERLAQYARDEHGTGYDTEVAVLHCRHRAYGVGMFDTAEVVAADALITAAGAAGSAEIIIGTVSHCHGALTRLVVGKANQSSSQAR